METMPSKTRRPPLRQEAIVDTAIALADEEGVEALTMRHLADRLDYKVMSLYNHVANKDELLTLMADEVASEIKEPVPGLDPLRAVRAIALAMREVLVQHPWAASAWPRYHPGPARTANMETLLRTLAERGRPEDLAHHGFHAVTNHVMGYTLQELEMAPAMTEGDPEKLAADFLAGLSPEEHPHTRAHIQQHLDGDTASSFELVLDLILDGLVQLSAEREAGRQRNPGLSG
jgi:AcrR family transcriptional regulator